MSVDQRLRAGLHAEAAALPPATVERDLALVNARVGLRRRRRWASGIAIAALGAAASVAVGAKLVTIVDDVRDPDAASPAARMPTELIGDYVVDIPDTTEANRLQVNGRWVVRIAADGTLDLTAPQDGADGAADASIRLERDHRVVTNALHSVPGCQAEPAVGTYEYTLGRDDLTFEVVGADCLGRILLFTSAPWQELP